MTSFNKEHEEAARQEHGQGEDGSVFIHNYCPYITAVGVMKWMEHISHPGVQVSVNKR